MTDLATRPWTRFYAPSTAQDLAPRPWGTVAEFREVIWENISTCIETDEQILAAFQ
jgi:hypothetical protein